MHTSIRTHMPLWRTKQTIPKYIVSSNPLVGSQTRKGANPREWTWIYKCVCMCVLSGDTHTYINTYIPYARIYIVTWVNKSKVQKKQFWLADTLDSYLLSSCLRMAWHNGNGNNDNQHEGPADAPFQPQFDGFFLFLLVAILHTCCLVSELSKEDWIYTDWYHPIWSNHDFFLSFVFCYSAPQPFRT